MFVSDTYFASLEGSKDDTQKPAKREPSMFRITPVDRPAAAGAK